MEKEIMDTRIPWFQAQDSNWNGGVRADQVQAYTINWDYEDPYWFGRITIYLKGGNTMECTFTEDQYEEFRETLATVSGVKEVVEIG